MDASTIWILILIAIVFYGAVSLFFLAALLKAATRTAVAVEAINAKG